MAEAQNGQSFVVGAAAAGARFILFTCRTSKKIAEATIRKSIMVFMKIP